MGPVTAQRLRERGIERLLDVRTAEAGVLREAVGSQSGWLLKLAHGIDDRPVTPHRETKSSGTENTFSSDLMDLTQIRAEIDGMARDGAAWLERKALLCRTVTIKVRYSDFTTVTRSHTRMPPSRDVEDIAARALALLEKTDAGRRPVRLLGVSVHNLVNPDQPDEDEIKKGDPRLPFE